MYVQSVVGEDESLMRVLMGKLARLTQRVPTICIENILAIMQEVVVGIPTIWICLMRRVVGDVLVYIEVAEAVVAEEVEEAGDQGDQDDYGGQDDQGGQD